MNNSTIISIQQTEFHREEGFIPALKQVKEACKRPTILISSFLGMTLSTAEYLLMTGALSLEPSTIKITICATAITIGAIHFIDKRAVVAMGLSHTATGISILAAAALRLALR